jgi:diguanylate cyclase (GGDEF)-like protein
VEAEARMLQATIDLLKSVVSPEQPLVMVVDDLQWAPAISLRFIDALMTQGRSLQGLLLVGAYRDAEVDAAHPLSAMLTRWEELGVAPPIMRLGNLPTGDVGALIAEMLRLPQRESARLGTALIERTDGNPYDTVELINALRQDGLLAPHDGQWQWDEAAIRQYVGDCDVVGLLSRRIDRLPAASQQVLGQLACLGGEVSMALLEVGSGLNTDALEALLAPALEDGLIVAHSGHEREIRFRHDRVQQAMHERMNGAAQLGEHLAMARRLSAQPTLSALAARQYLPAFDAVTDPEECRNVIGQFLGSALLNKVVNFELSERFLSAAITLSGRLDMDASDQACLFMLQGERHAALVGLGRLDEADAVYEAIAAAQPDPLDLVDMAAVQIASLGNRQRNKEAMALGLGLLDALGFPHPESVETAIGMALFKLATWVGSPEMAADLARPELSDPRLLAVAKLLSKTQVAAFFCAAKTSAWLTLLGQSLWVEHGPCPTLMATMCASPVLLIATAEDYDSAYKLGQHLLAVGEQRRYEPATSVARFMFAMSTGHWREPVEDIVAHYRKAREGLFQAGDLQYGIFTYSAWTNLFDTLPTIEAGIEENDGAFTVSARTGDKNFLYIHGASRQLHKTLRGLIPADQPWGSFSDDSFDEAAHAASLTKPSIAGAYYHVERALSAAIFDDAAALHHHALAAMPLLYRIPGYYIVAQAHVLNALALANALRTLPAQATATDTPEPTPTGAEANHSEDRAKLLATLDKSLKWLKRRAKDAPANFLHLQQWIEAERAWALGEHWAAAASFNTAMDSAAQRSRPWHLALITERAARFHLAQGMHHTGRPLLKRATHLYEAWGASAKVSQLHEAFTDLHTGGGNAGRSVRQRESPGRSTIVSTDMVDVMSVLRASQALSSETSLERLNDRVSKVLGAMTGAASVLLVVRTADEQGWQVFVPDGDKAQTITLDEAVAQTRLPLSAFHYAERTREPLLINEATRDERFARDPYFEGLTQCALLLLPVLSKGALRGMLVLENRISRGAFSAERLDAVSLIAGQLSVSLDNALLYASLAQKVAERTAALEEANQRLELLSATDALTGVANRRKFNEALDAEWLRARRTQSPIGLVLIDIDHFKLYNDHYGHQGGDACLQLVATTMRAGLRAGSDLIARYGGEEFVLLLPNTDLQGTLTVAERVRAAVAARAEPHLNASHGIVTVSVGITSFVPSGEAKATQYIELADQALYEAKRAGRNRVCGGATAG